MEEQMTPLMQLFEDRETTYDEMTRLILDKLDTVTSAAVSMLGEEARDRVLWKSAAVVDDTVFVAGELNFEVGEVITAEDEELTVTEDLLPLLNRVVRVGVPLSMAEGSSREEILDYLKGLEQQENLEAMVNEGSNTSIETVADLAGEFRSAGLTREQIDSMIIFAEQSKGKVN